MSGAARVAAVALLVVGGFVVGGSMTAARRASAQADLVSTGRRLYTQSCASCHGLTGRGTKQGPTLIGVGAASADFYLSTGRMPLDQPVTQANRKPPAFARSQIRALTAYVASLGPGPPIPRVNLARGSLLTGQRVYTTNCAACHNSSGSGGALGGHFFAPRLTQATPVQVAEAVRIGPGAMPVFGPEAISDQQLDSVALYVERLKHGENHGGLPLGNIGPVPEGFVAWLIGAGALVLVTFWIGTRE